METMPQDLQPSYSLRIEPDPSDSDDLTATDLLHCPACGSNWISSRQPSFDSDGEAVFTVIGLSCSQCLHDWELCLSDRKGQVSLSYGPSDPF
jgi:hypothetical protein